MAISKVIYGGTTLIDLTKDSVTADKILVNKTTGKGYTAHGADGEEITGTCTFDADTSDANATEAEILKGKTAYKNGVKLTGMMTNNGAVNGTISNINTPYSIPIGYHDGSGKVSISDTEKEKIISQNIREGVSILGVTGTMSGSESEKKQIKEVTPTKDGFTVLADTANGYTCLSEVLVKPIPYVERENGSGGLTVTIA